MTPKVVKLYYCSIYKVGLGKLKLFRRIFFQFSQPDSSWIVEDCSSICRCEEGEVICTAYECHEYAECMVKNGERNCYCQRGYRGDGQICEQGENYSMLEFQYRKIEILEHF